jgi:DNA polymerase III epsilon subunit-like protein
MVADAPSVEEVIREFAVFVGDLPLVGHNIKSSDLHYITRALKRAGIAMDNGFFDTYLYAKTLKDRYGWENVKLEYLSQVFGVEQPEAHRAYCDAEVNVGVYFKLKELD